MGWLAGLLSLGFTLLAGCIFIGLGGAFASLTLQFAGRRFGAGKLPYRRLWKLSSLAFLVGLLLGSAVQIVLGGPSPLTPIVAIPLYLLFYVQLLRRQIPEPFANAHWRWRTLGMVVLATAAGGTGVFLLLRVLQGILS